ncbi:hypothetical protein ACFWBX_34455 [Streptomyces sp. NPDC059991]|uniref:hypothetical protein n=1 Tax=Streptomyces sp. NPDC059991 TaxID=3347028 RepID=UPI00368AD3A8
MSALPNETPPRAEPGPQPPQTAAEIRGALPEEVRAQFDEALDAATLTERAHVLLLWRSIAADMADPRGDRATQAVIDGTSRAKTWDEWRAEGAL